MDDEGVAGGNPGVDKRYSDRKCHVVASSGVCKELTAR